MLLRGFADTVIVCSQQVLASVGGVGFLLPHHCSRIFTAHGIIVIFFMAMLSIAGSMNLAVPLQLGTCDVAFPSLNSLSF